MPRLTKTLIESHVSPERGQTFLRDDELRGFGVRFTPNCASFFVEGRVNGIKRRITIGRYGTLSVEVARKEARRLLAEFALGLDVVAQAPAPTLQEVLDRYLIERTMKNQTRKSYRSLCNRSIGDWLGLPITEITPAMVQERHKDLVRPTRCGTDNKGCANTVMWLLNSLMKFAACTYEVDGKPLLENSPVRRLSQVRQWYKKESRQGLMPDNKLADFYRAIMNRIASARRQFT